MTAPASAPLQLRCDDETATGELAARLARALASEEGPLVIALRGPLGSGKTSFVRALLRALGVAGAVRSPTYTLVEEHDAGSWRALHLDLYRLSPGESLAELGLRDAHVPGTLMLVEWPERAAARALPPVDLELQLFIEGEHARRLEASAPSAAGVRLRSALAAERVS